MKNNLGEKLIYLRKQKKLTQEQVADKLNVTRQTISNWELNQTKPDIDQIKGISKFYKISVDELIDSDIKDILTEKISNTERLAGLIIKMLKIFSILAIIIFIIFVLYKMFFDCSYAWFIGENLEHKCTLKDEIYYIQIKNKPNERKIGYNMTLITAGDMGDVIDVIISPYIVIPDLEKYSKVYQVKNVIYNYFEYSGGTCEHYIYEYDENN